MNRSILKLGFAIMAVALFPAMGFADLMVGGVTRGGFNDQVPALSADYLNLTFIGLASFGYPLPDSGVLENVKLDSFEVRRSERTLDYDGSFTLEITLTAPAILNGGATQSFIANLSGAVKKNGANDSPLKIEFSSSPTPITFAGGNPGTFYLTLDNIEGLGATATGNEPGPWTAELTGDLRGAAVASTPEPAAIVLFGSMLTGLCILRKRTRKPTA